MLGVDIIKQVTHHTYNMVHMENSGSLCKIYLQIVPHKG